MPTVKITLPLLLDFLPAFESSVDSMVNDDSAVAVVGGVDESSDVNTFGKQQRYCSYDTQRQSLAPAVALDRCFSKHATVQPVDGGIRIRLGSANAAFSATIAADVRSTFDSGDKFIEKDNDCNDGDDDDDDEVDALFSFRLSSSGVGALLFDVDIVVADVAAVAAATVSVAIAIAAAFVTADADDVRSCEMHDSWLCTFDSKLLHLPKTLNISSRLLLSIYANKLSGGMVNVVWPQLLQNGVAGLFER